MGSPEFQAKLQQARDYRREEAVALSRTGSKVDVREYLDVLREDPRYIEARRLVVFARWEKLAQKDIPEFTEQDFKIAGRIFSGINNGVKAAVLVTIAQNSSPKNEQTGVGSYMPISKLVESFRKLFVGTELLEAISANHNEKHQVIEYCRDSLCGVGLVTGEYGMDNELVGFGITEEGVSLGTPAALLILRGENRTNQSIYPFLGTTNSNGKTRAPFNRIRILGYLMHNPYNVRVFDLNTILKDDIKLFDNLSSMREAGLVDYKSIKHATGNVRIEYELVPNKALDQSPKINRNITLQKYIVGIINQTNVDQQTRRFRISVAQVIGKLPEELIRKWKTETLRHEVNAILNGLTDKGFLVKVDDFEGGNKLSEISITEIGRGFFMQTLLPVLLLASGRPLSQRQIEHLEESRDRLGLYAQTSAEAYYPYSTSSKARRHEERVTKVIDMLSDADTFLNTRDIVERSGISEPSVRKYIEFSPVDSNIRLIIAGNKTAILDVHIMNGVVYYKLRNKEDFIKKS